MSKQQLAITWNGNEAGRLWTKYWYKEGKHFFSRLEAPGVFVPDGAYTDEQAFWQAYEAEANEFNGKKVERLSGEHQASQRTSPSNHKEKI